MYSWLIFDIFALYIYALNNQKTTPFENRKQKRVLSYYQLTLTQFHLLRVPYCNSWISFDNFAFYMLRTLQLQCHLHGCKFSGVCLKFMSSVTNEITFNYYIIMKLVRNYRFQIFIFFLLGPMHLLCRQGRRHAFAVVVLPCSPFNLNLFI